MLYFVRRNNKTKENKMKRFSLKIRNPFSIKRNGKGASSRLFFIDNGESVIMFVILYGTFGGWIRK
jgi:hypothetical protein